MKVHVTCILKIIFYGWKVKAQYISHFHEKNLVYILIIYASSDVYKGYLNLIMGRTLS